LNDKYQTEKSKLGSIAQETISNIRTVKAFADENGSIEQYRKQNTEVYSYGYKKSIVWGLFMFGMKVFQSSAFAAMLFIIGRTYT